MSHHHLARDEREIIVIGLRIGVSPQEIASRIGRSRSTLRRERPRNGGARDDSGVRAQDRSGKVRESCRRSLKLSDPFVLEILRRGMKKHWSPEQVIHREQLFLSVPTVYRRNRPRTSGSDSALASPQRERLRSLVAVPLRSRASPPPGGSGSMDS